MRVIVAGRGPRTPAWDTHAALAASVCRRTLPEQALKSGRVASGGLRGRLHALQGCAQARFQGAAVPASSTRSTSAMMRARRPASTWCRI